MNPQVFSNRWSFLASTAAVFLWPTHGMGIRQSEPSLLRPALPRKVLRDQLKRYTMVLYQMFLFWGIFLMPRALYATEAAGLRPVVLYSANPQYSLSLSNTDSGTVVDPLVLGTTAPELAIQQWFNTSDSASHSTFGDGHIYVLTFTASWCETCQKIYPVMDSIKKQFASKGVRLIYATQIFGFYGGQFQHLPLAAELDSLRAYFLTKHKVTSPVAIVPVATMLKYFPGGDVHLPRIFVIDGAGKIRRVYDGWLDSFEESLIDQLAVLLKSGTARSTT